jgi:hypothetical protein
MFLFYVMWRLTKTQEVVVLHRGWDMGKIFIFTQSASFYTTNKDTIWPFLDDEKTWYLADTLHPPPVRYEAITLLVAPPARRHFGDFMKTALPVLMHYLPVWTLEECLSARTHYAVSEDVIRERFRLIGGIARFIFNVRVDLTRIIENALAGLNRETLFRVSCKELGEDEDACHAIVHLQVQSDDYTRATPLMSSQQVVEIAFRRYHMFLRSELALFLKMPILSLDIATYSEKMFESYAHDTISRGGVFKYRALDNGNVTSYELMLDMRDIRYFCSVKECQTDNTYYIPDFPNHPCIDAYAPSLGHFQMTTNFKPGILYEEMKGIVRDTSEYNLYFVVPHYMYDSYPQQGWVHSDKTRVDDAGWTKSKRRKESFSGKFRQFVLSIPFEAFC